MIHESAVVASDAVVGTGSTVGPFCVIGVDGTGAPTTFGIDAIVRSHCVVYRGVVAGDRLHLGHGALVRDSTRLGDDVSIGTHSIVEHHVELANGVRLHSDCFVPEHCRVEEGAWLGPGVRLTNSKYPNRPDSKEQLEGVLIGSGAVLGAATVVLPGVVVGAGALVGAGSVVVRDVAPGTVVAGNPAQVLR